MPVETPAKPILPPSDWRMVPLKDVADVRFSSVDKLNLPGETKVRLCNYTDVYNNDYITPHFDFMEASASDSEIARFGLMKGDVIITKDSETPDDIGIPCVIDETAPDLVCGYHLGLIRPDLGKVDPTFLSKQIGHRRIARYFAHQANGLTRYGLPIGSVQDAPLWLPDPTEQKLIGALLRNLDALIAKSEAVIAKLRQVRSGLLHDLLTRGLDAHGQLRDPATHPEQFKDSPLGRIPKEWKVKTLDEIRKEDAPICYGIVQVLEHVPDGVQVLAIRDLLGDYSTGLHKTAPAIDANYARSRVSAGDVLISIKGTIGRIGLVPDHYVGNISRDIARVRPDQSVLPRFLMHLLRSPNGQRTLECAQVGTTRAELSIGPLKDLRFPIPSLPEQEQIANLLDSHDRQLVSEQATLAKLRQLKSGLMTDLLEGRVRVPEFI